MGRQKQNIGTLESPNWVYTDTGATGDMQAANNLSDLANAATARTNLGLGTAATYNVPATGNAASGQVVLGSDTRLGATTDIAATTHAASSKTTPVDADEVPLVDSAASYGLKRLTWANAKATLKTYFDTLYAAVTHTHAESDITNLTTDLAAKAPLASPTFTGTPAAPTATTGSSSTQLATTAFVQAAISGLSGGSASTPDTLGVAVPAMNGAIGWSSDPAGAGNTNQPTAGVVQYQKQYARTVTTITSLSVYVTVAGSGLSNCYLAVFNSSGTQIGITANISTALQSTGTVNAALTASVDVSGVYYTALLIGNGSTTAPTLARAAAGAASNAGLTAAAGWRFWTAGSALTAMPSSVTISSGTQSSQSILVLVNGTATTAAATDIAATTHAATSKATPVDADELPLIDSAASNVLKKLTWANLKATAKAYFDTLYEKALGNPSSDGYVLSSTAAGVRSWVAQSSGSGFTNPMSAAGDIIVGGGAALTNEALVASGASLTTSKGALNGGGSNSVIDNDDTTNGWMAGTPVGNWARINLGSAKTIHSFRFVQKNLTSSGDSAAALTFTIESSNDDTTWTTRHTQSTSVPNTTPSNSGTIAFSGGAATAQYWRLTPLTQSGAYNWVLNTWELISGGTAGTPTALPKGGNNTVFGVNSSGTQGYRTLASTDVSDFTEASQDVVGAMVAAAGGTYNDAAGTITLPSGGGGSGALTLISTQTLSGSAATITFSSIPGTYRDLVLEVTGRLATNNTNNYKILLQLNGDTSASYDYLNGSTAAVGGTYIFAGILPLSTDFAGQANTFEARLPAYTQTTWNKTIYGKAINQFGAATGSMEIRQTYGRWANTAAVTSLTLFCDGTGGQFATGTIASLYGMS